MGNPERSNKALRRKNTAKRIMAAVSVALLILVAVVLFTRRNVQKKYGNRSIVKVESAEVTTGSVRTTVSGSGALVSEDMQEITLPGPVKVDTVYVSAGDTVEEGMLLASVNTGSVLSALSDAQSQLDSLDKQLKAAADEKVSAVINAGVTGRVKAIYAEKGDMVADVMYTHGALALLSLDGYMAADVEADGYSVGDTVTVTTSDGKTYEGTVDAVTDAGATVLITDNGPLNGDTVTVNDKDQATLYIHSPMKVIGYAGRIAYFSVMENSFVSNGSNLFSLEDTAYAVNYEQLLKDRAEYEELFLTLVKLYKDGGILATRAGTVETVVDEDGSTTAAAPASAASSAASAAAAAMGYSLPTSAAAPAASKSTGLLDENLVLTLDPCETMSVTLTVDETDILSLAVNQEAAITVDSIGEDSFTGVVTEIDTTAADGGYMAKVTLPRAERMLPGMTADVAVTIEGVENALLLPDEAVQRTSSSAYVYTSYDEETDTLGGMVEVTAGLSNGKLIEIVGGIQEGDTVFYIPKEKTYTFGNFTFTAGGSNRKSGSPMG